jgi:hypothetical protein
MIQKYRSQHMNSNAIGTAYFGVDASPLCATEFMSGQDISNPRPA